MNKNIHLTPDKLEATEPFIQDHPVEEHPVEEGYLVSTPTCHIPDLNPFAEDVMKIFRYRMADLFISYINEWSALNMGLLFKSIAIPIADHSNLIAS